MPTLEAIGTAVPEHPLPQAELRDTIRELFLAGDPRAEAIAAAFDRTGIDTRYTAMPQSWYLERQGWRSRSEAYAREGLALIERAARAALDAAHVPPTAIGGVVLVSTTGIATPSLDARLATRLGIPPGATRAPLWGLGCAGGVAGVNRAADLARAHPDKRILLVAVELCTLSFRLDDRSTKSLIATALFGDGAAAALIAGDALTPARDGPRIEAGGSHLFPASEDVMGWNVLDDGLDVVFSQRIPDIVAAEMRDLVDGFLKEHTNGRPPDRYVFHPGGTKVLTAYEEALGIPPEALRESREALRKYGNLSSPTVLFALAESLERPLRPGETALLAALGPGFASELSLLTGPP